MATFITRLEVTHGRMKVAVKDLIDMAGLPTTNGSRVIAARAERHPAKLDAACLAGTRSAESDGRVTIAGKTNMHELAFGVTGINPWFGTPVNPLDPALVPGGSSSGSAVAVATGEADVAYGSDTGGSVRMPAACCGVVGLKTTRGRVSLDGVLPLAPSLDTVGPMGATVAAVVGGMRLLEPGFQPAPETVAIGRLRLPADAWVDHAIDDALGSAGLSVADVALPGWDDATEAVATILGAEAWEVHEQLWREHAGELSPDVAQRLGRSSSITAAQLAAAWERAVRWDEELKVTFAGGTRLIALPTIATTPPTHENAARLTEIRYVAPFNMAGLPAISMPVATPISKQRPVPASLQLVAPAGGEELLCAVAAAIEAAAPFRP